MNAVDTPRVVMLPPVTGVYRFTRNPYLGMLVLFAGLALLFRLEPGLITLPLLALALHHGVVRREEAYLTAKFGESYRQLLTHSRRWI